MMILLKIKILRLWLLCVVISIASCISNKSDQDLSITMGLDLEKSSQDSVSTSSFSHLRIEMMIENGESEHFNLKSVTRSLANKYLPVWNIQLVTDEKCKEKSDTQLKLIPEVMNNLGEFTFYHESMCTSAAVYFHRRRQFFGMLDYRYLIHGLSIDEVDASRETKLWLDKSAIVSRKKFIGHQEKILTARRNNTKKRKRKEKCKGETNMICHAKSRTRSYPYDGYPEILVIISWELANKIMETEDESQKYTSIVLYVLTLFNGVDMLYSKLQDTKLELNIAGIIFGNDSKSFDFMKDCIIDNNKMKESNGQITLAECSNYKLRKFLYRKRKVTSLESYDTVVFLTSNRLLGLVDGNNNVDEPKRKKIKGEAACYKEEFYKVREKNTPLILVATVRDDGSFDSYSNIAHELAHLMTVKHDPSPLVKDGCHANIMKKGSDWFYLKGGWCKTCLSWSETSEKSFSSFFSSRNCCMFINKPISLHLPGYRQKLTADDQCRCYGFYSTSPSNNNQTKGTNFCQSPLQCLGYNNKFYYTVTPMNGTPCHHKKVCWEKFCRRITDSKPELCLAGWSDRIGN